MTSETPVTPSAPTPEGAIQGRDTLRATLAALMAEATREIRLYTPRLDPVFFNYSVVVDAFGHFATRHPRNRIQLLIEDTATVQDNQRLLALARRLTDRLELHEVGEQDRGGAELYLIIDRTMHLHQGDILRSDAVVIRQKPHDTLQLINQFDTAWHRSSGIALRPLGL